MLKGNKKKSEILFINHIAINSVCESICVQNQHIRIKQTGNSINAIRNHEIKVKSKELRGKSSNPKF